MRSECKILIASAILITALIVPSITMTTSWYSDVEEANVNVSILSIDVIDNSSGNTISGTNWKWTLAGGKTYTIKASIDTYLFVTGGPISNPTTDTNGIITIAASGTEITTIGEVTLSLYP